MSLTNDQQHTASVFKVSIRKLGDMHNQVGGDEEAFLSRIGMM